jgi:hypothetical protein
MTIERNPRIDEDVELLLGRFRDILQDGRLIRHDEIEAVLGIRRTVSRYKTVTNKWRRILMEEQRVFLDGRSALGEGFKSLTPDDMIRYTNRRVRQMGHMLRKALQVASLPHPSELKNSEARVFQARLLVACEQIVQAHKHVLVDLAKAMKPPRALPRVVGGKE